MKIKFEIEFNSKESCKRLKSASVLLFDTENWVGFHRFNWLLLFYFKFEWTIQFAPLYCALYPCASVSMRKMSYLLYFRARSIGMKWNWAIAIIRTLHFVLTRYPPKCRTWQVNVASRPTATEILTIGSANSGWNVRTSAEENKERRNVSVLSRQRYLWWWWHNSVFRFIFKPNSSERMTHFEFLVLPEMGLCRSRSLNDFARQRLSNALGSKRCNTNAHVGCDEIEIVESDRGSGREWEWGAKVTASNSRTRNGNGAFAIGLSARVFNSSWMRVVKAIKSDCCREKWSERGRMVLRLAMVHSWWYRCTLFLSLK